MTRLDLAAGLLKELRDGDADKLLSALDGLSKNAVDLLQEAVENWQDEHLLDMPK